MVDKLFGKARQPIEPYAIGVFWQVIGIWSWCPRTGIATNLIDRMKGLFTSTPTWRGIQRHRQKRLEGRGLSRVLNRERGALTDDFERGFERGFERFEFCIVGGVDHAGHLLAVAAEAFG